MRAQGQLKSRAAVGGLVRFDTNQLIGQSMQIVVAGRLYVGSANMYSHCTLSVQCVVSLSCGKVTARRMRHSAVP